MSAEAGADPERLRALAQMKANDLDIHRGQGDGELDETMYGHVLKVGLPGPVDGRVDITVAAEGSEAVIRIADNGCGMPPEVQARVWEPFFTTKGDEGTGLGLDVCRRLIEAHAGRITFVTTPQVGTVFEVRLPRLAPADPSA